MVDAMAGASSRCDPPRSARHKLLKFWLQSFLANVPRIVVGWRDDAGVVQRLQDFETKTMHRQARATSDANWARACRSARPPRVPPEVVCGYACSWTHAS
jgi:hypothetical protein